MKINKNLFCLIFLNMVCVFTVFTVFGNVTSNNNAHANNYKIGTKKIVDWEFPHYEKVVEYEDLLYCFSPETGMDILSLPSLLKVGNLKGIYISKNSHINSSFRITGLSLYENRLYLTIDGSIIVLNLSDSLTPKIDYIYKLEDKEFSYIFVSENRIYTKVHLNDGYKFSIIELDSKKYPSEIYYYDTYEGWDFINVKDNYVFIPDYNSGIYILDTNQLDNIHIVKEIKFDGLRSTTYANYMDNYIICTQDNKILIFDISNPSDTKKISEIDRSSNYYLRVYIAYNKLYVLTKSSVLEIYDLSILDQISLENTLKLDIPNNVLGIFIKNDFMIYNEGDEGIQKIDLNEFKNFSENDVTEYSINNDHTLIFDVATVDENYLYGLYKNYLYIYDIGDVENPIEIKSIKIEFKNLYSDRVTGQYDILIDGDLLILTYSYDSLVLETAIEIYNIEDKLNPVLLNSQNLTSDAAFPPYSIYKKTNYLFLKNSWKTSLFEIDENYKLNYIDSFDTFWNFLNIAISDDYLFAGFLVYSIKNINNIEFSINIGSLIETSTYSYLKVKNNYLYCYSGYQLRIVDITNIENPILVYIYSFNVKNNVSISNILIKDNNLFVINDTKLVTFDISNPDDIKISNEEKIFGIEMNYYFYKMEFSGNKIYIHRDLTYRSYGDNYYTFSGIFFKTAYKPNISLFTSDKTSGLSSFSTTLSVQADDYYGPIEKYKWDFNGDGIVDEETTDNQTSHTYEKPGNYNVTVTAENKEGMEETSNPFTITSKKETKTALPIKITNSEENLTVTNWLVNPGETEIEVELKSKKLNSQNELTETITIPSNGKKTDKVTTFIFRCNNSTKPQRTKYNFDK